MMIGIVLPGYWIIESTKHVRLVRTISSKFKGQVLHGPTDMEWSHGHITNIHKLQPVAMTFDFPPRLRGVGTSDAGSAERLDHNLFRT